jgi:hypothetical protein
MYREAGESYEDFYRRAVQLFKDRYKPTEVEIGNYLTQLHTMAKGVDESIRNYVQRFNRAWDLAYPHRPGTTGRALEDKKRAFLQGIESDVQDNLHIGGGPSKYTWLEFIARLEVLFRHRNPDAMLRATQERLRMQQASATIQGSKQHMELTRGVDRPLKDFVNGGGQKVSVAEWAEDPFQTPAPLASTLRAINGGSSSTDSGAASSQGGRGRQRNRGGRGGQKRARSPSPPPLAAAATVAASPHDGRQDDDYRERQRQNANKRPRDSKGHFRPGVKNEHTGHASGANATPQGSGPPERYGVDTAGTKVIVRGPCSSCGLNHHWDFCKRNPQARNFVESERGKTGLHFLATLDGYRPGDENGAYKKLPSFIAQRGTGRANSAGQQ